MKPLATDNGKTDKINQDKQLLIALQYPREQHDPHFQKPYAHQYRYIITKEHSTGKHTYRIAQNRTAISTASSRQPQPSPDGKVASQYCAAASADGAGTRAVLTVNVGT